ncbi:S-adenosylmethionine:tRNA ribosyltransferase-isomerase [Porifericola rhodea]|uniref:S-adenosylmethionine:tRNA ribosyltransferase-isomerase n=1 Tax=Porifericola rhodea TaxID=930972 RepID=UPI002666DD41|nr:S-adenosylmethionine:tRNA ribosyltransferase-isomerase [Porifericola rhodea]WKN30140.1 S-adenosylmethionine:tRNA ribosyltransferase-isomerase [Porifericola rhodea]
MTRESIQLEAYNYHLPEERIARFPLEKRDSAKLLHYQSGKINDKIFHELPELLPAHSQLFFNATKVIPARLFFQKPSTAQGSGAIIEVFLLNPLLPSSVIGEAMLAKKSCSWHCMIGNKKKWKSGLVLEKTLMVYHQEVVLSAHLEDTEQASVRFTWDAPEVSFVDIVEAAGKVPLPPYIKREATDEDKPRYQTVYSKQEGAVAAPTAGLHFTPEVLQKLADKGMGLDYLTLHVSAGTFQPIKEEDVRKHPMHSEQMVIGRKHVEKLLSPQGPVIAVGTTSMRTLESLYWFGSLLENNPEATFRVPKLVAYEEGAAKSLSLKASMENVLGYMEARQLEQLVGETEIFIFPGYKFRVCEGLVTNFHMPKSTLILLIATLVGEDWKRIYKHALQNNYRFLSYGDSSLLLPQK